MLFAKKRDLHDPNNWRGTNLLDAGLKTMSMILNARTQKLFLKSSGKSMHFGETLWVSRSEAVFI